MLQDSTIEETALRFYFITDAEISTEWKQRGSEKQS